MREFEIGRQLTESLSRWARRAPPFAALYFAVAAPLSIFELRYSNPYAGIAANLGQVVVGAFTFGAVCIAIHERRATFRAALSRPLRALPALFGLTLVIAFAIIAGTILCLVPGLIAGAVTTLVIPFYVLGDAGFVDSLRRAFEAASDHLPELTVAWGIAFFGYLALAVGATAALLAGASETSELFGVPVTELGPALAGEAFSALLTTYFAAFGVVAYETLAARDLPETH